MKPLVVEFAVAAPCDHAFSMWSSRTALWWPRSHTVTKSDELDIIFEGRVGGRIYERGSGGDEHDWGEITAWEPPHRVAYRWHLFFDPAEATDVEVTFTPSDDGTNVRIEQRGWERIGAAARERRTNTDRAWAAIVPLYVDAAGSAPAPPEVG